MRPLSVLLTCLLAASALGAEPALMRAERAFDSLEFDTAAEAFHEALRQPGTREERLRAWRGLALSEAFMGQAKQAQAAFESLLTLEPDAEVSRTLGPKVRKPYEEARFAMQGRRSRLTLVREKDGRVVTTLGQARPLATELVLALRQPGTTDFTVVRGRASGPVSAPASPVRLVEAYVVARDAAGGILFEEGSEKAPVHLEATEALLPAVTSPQGAPAEELHAQQSEGGGRVWPWLLGGAGVVAAGVVAGIVLAQPPALNLPPADRTQRLP